MSAFPCGCPLEPQYPEQRCAKHRDWECHHPLWSAVAAGVLVWDKDKMDLCPPCRRAQMVKQPSRFIR